MEGTREDMRQAGVQEDGTGEREQWRGRTRCGEPE